MENRSRCVGSKYNSRNFSVASEPIVVNSRNHFPWMTLPLAILLASAWGLTIVAADPATSTAQSLSVTPCPRDPRAGEAQRPLCDTRQERGPDRGNPL